ncbi:Golgi-associated plant pathogenesis-related protein 1 [Pseudolycoriella hygida]|uniref:Golgi-associated plant pathogenesis-related protein 1 n=1 Tax=Pseudolycoriella hygida TaxID=35572 RepID=A0A9Q0S4A7_9DIPT|nr:Golgi-associated plant pathogenesis-related protein 1 [Pseudolycoriella hygida]
MLHTFTTIVFLSIAARLVLCGDMIKEDAIQRNFHSDYRNMSLALHNMFRENHGTKPLRQDDKLNQVAERYARHAAKTGRSDLKDDRFGVNIFLTKDQSLSKSRLVYLAIKKWYSEESMFDYGKQQLSNETSHFTQMVWAETRTLSTAIVHGDYGLACACVYFSKVFPDNILPPIEPCKRL